MRQTGWRFIIWGNWIAPLRMDYGADVQRYSRLVRMRSWERNMRVDHRQQVPCWTSGLLKIPMCLSELAHPRFRWICCTPASAMATGKIINIFHPGWNDGRLTVPSTLQVLRVETQFVEWSFSETWNVFWQLRVLHRNAFVNKVRTKEEPRSNDLCGSRIIASRAWCSLVDRK